MISVTGNFWLGLMAAPLLIGCYGLIVEKALIRPLQGRDINYPLLLTFGLQFIMIEIVRMFWGTSDQPFPPPRRSVHLWAFLAPSIFLPTDCS